MPDFASPATLTSPLPDNGWVVDHSLNVSTVAMIDGVAVAQGDWWNGRWSGNINLQMLAPKGSTVTETLLFDTNLAEPRLGKLNVLLTYQGHFRCILY